MTGAVVAGWLVLTGLSASGRADGTASFRDWLTRCDVQVVTVTDMTPQGRLLRVPSRAQPMYYEALVAGFVDFGSSVAGLDIPNKQEMLKLILKLLADQGYYPGTPQHKPEILLEFAWGTLNGRSGTALAFMGGEKLDVMWELEPLSIHTARHALTRFARSQVADFVVDASFSGGLYVISIRAFDEQAAIGGRLVPLWETKVSCPSAARPLTPTLRRMAREAAPYIGRDMAKPVCTIAPPHDLRVELGELKVMEFIDPKKLPILDLVDDPAAPSKTKP